MSIVPTAVQRDERTIAVENSSYRWSYLFLSFGLLAIVAGRSFVRNEAPWDLLLLVVLGGGVGTAYQAYHKVLTRNWIVVTLISMLVAAALAVAWARLG